MIRHLAVSAFIESSCVWNFPLCSFPERDHFFTNKVIKWGIKSVIIANKILPQTIILD